MDWKKTLMIGSFAAGAILFLTGRRPAGLAVAGIGVATFAVENPEKFEELWRRLGLSIDWSMTYQTIDETARAISQRAFLRNLARGEAYQAEAPTLWDVSFRTAVAQAELEDREIGRASCRERV